VERKTVYNSNEEVRGEKDAHYLEVRSTLHEGGAQFAEGGKEKNSLAWTQNTGGKLD